MLLHGFPQTHRMWRLVAPALAQRFTVICVDLRGYRSMADEMVAVMERLGFPRFSVAAHDRGGRVAYRLALDHPERLERLAVLDILPLAEVWEPADKRPATTYWQVSASAA
jgi:haloacetate dehalogenase